MQRRLRAAAAAFLLAAGGFGIGTAHAADNVSQTCTATGDAGTTHGGCVSAGQAGNVTALLSDVCAQDALQQATGTTNRGQCLKMLRALVP